MFRINEEIVFLFKISITGGFSMIYALLVLIILEFLNSENSKQMKI